MADSTNIKTEKSTLRKKMLDIRSAMENKERESANAKMHQLLVELPEYKNADTIFIYVSVIDEPDTRALIQDAWLCGKRVCVPKCLSLGVMHAHEIRSMDDLQPGKYDIPEPKDTCPRVKENEISLNIVPCVCCSFDGFRLGYGGGFYDRWLDQVSAPSALLCYGKMLVDEVPREAHDQRVDILVSDAFEKALRF